MRFMAMAWELVRMYQSSLRRPVRSLLPNQVELCIKVDILVLEA